MAHEISLETDDALFLRLYDAADAQQKEQLVDRKYMSARTDHEHHSHRKHWSDYPVYAIESLERKLHQHLQLDNSIVAASY